MTMGVSPVVDVHDMGYSEVVELDLWIWVSLVLFEFDQRYADASSREH